MVPHLPCRLDPCAPAVLAGATVAAPKTSACQHVMSSHDELHHLDHFPRINLRSKLFETRFRHLVSASRCPQGPAPCELTFPSSLHNRRMTDLPAALRRRNLSACSIYRAASARSENLTLLLRALSLNPPLNVRMPVVKQRTADGHLDHSGNPCICRCFAGKCGDLANGRFQNATASRIAAAPHGGKEPEAAKNKNVKPSDSG